MPAPGLEPSRPGAHLASVGTATDPAAIASLAMLKAPSVHTGTFRLNFWRRCDAGPCPTAGRVGLASEHAVVADIRAIALEVWRPVVSVPRPSESSSV